MEVYFYGASGHAKVVKDIVEANGMTIAAMIDDNPALTELAGVPVIHDAKGKSPMIISIGNCDIRRQIAERLDCEFITAIHPSAIISPSAKIGVGTVVMQGAIIQADAHIGDHVIINIGATIDHECQIADFVHVSPGVHLGGNVSVGSGSWVGIGSSVIQGISIGSNTLICAGSVVTKDIPDNVIAGGNPARVIRSNHSC